MSEAISMEPMPISQILHHFFPGGLFPAAPRQIPDLGIRHLSRAGQAGTSKLSKPPGIAKPPGMGNPRNQRRKAFRKRKADEAAAKLRASEVFEAAVNSAVQAIEPSTSGGGAANGPPGANGQVIPPGMGKWRNQRRKAHRKWKAEEAAAKLKASEASEAGVPTVKSEPVE